VQVAWSTAATQRQPKHASYGHMVRIDVYRRPGCKKRTRHDPFRPPRAGFDRVRFRTHHPEDEND
jgi:hypothetical protein